MYSKRILAALLLLAANCAAAADRAHEYRLDNGLLVIVKEDHRAPVVVSQIWYKVGASYEHGGLTGVSHLLEHMMFKGTDAVGPGEFSRIISENGGRENAFTGQDYTAYFQRLEKSRLETSFRLEADRMRNLLLPADEFEKERQVVIEERRMRTDDKPRSLAYEHFMATAWQNSPYQNPIIGWRTDLENLRVEDLGAWYRHWYTPSNATLVVVGDVEPGEVLRLAKKHFGPIEGEPPPLVKPQTEVGQIGEKRITLKIPAELPYLVMGYKVPALRTAEQASETYALDVLATILDGDDSARLSKHLIRGSGIAASAGAGYDMYDRLDGLFLLTGVPSADRTVAELEAALLEQIGRLQTELVSEEELRRVKTQVVTADIYERDSVFYQAMQIGQLATVGIDWRLGDEYVQRIDEVTAEQVREVARKYLVADRLTVAELSPLPIQAGAAPAPQGGMNHVR